MEKQELVRARVARQLRTKGLTSASEYLDDVMGDPEGEEFSSLIDALSTNLTSFYREPQHFTYLSNVLVPRILERRQRRGTSRLRGWSAACSTGEEPYTIAITLLESLPSPAKWDVKVLATDISRNVLKTAVTGRYAASRVESVREPIRSRYFRSIGTGNDGTPAVEISQEARSLITFNYLNLIETWPFHGFFDFIFCRNVMIYFDRETQSRLVNRFWSQLEQGGILFTGHSESLTGISHRFQYVQPSIYMKV